MVHHHGRGPVIHGDLLLTLDALCPALRGRGREVTPDSLSLLFCRLKNQHAIAEVKYFRIEGRWAQLFCFNIFCPRYSNFIDLQNSITSFSQIIDLLALNVSTLSSRLLYLM